MAVGRFVTVAAAVAAALLLALAAPAPVHAVPNTVVTELVSPWAETPLLLEGLELYAQYEPAPGAFWDYLTSVLGARGRAVQPARPSPLCFADRRMRGVPAHLFAARAAHPYRDAVVADALLAAAGTHLPPLTSEAFKLALYARSAAPAVVAALQIAREHTAALAACPAGPAVALPGGGVACTAADVAALDPAGWAAHEPLAMCVRSFEPAGGAGA